MFQQFDEWLFYAINNGWANPIFDKMMPFITEVDSWLLLYLLGFYILLFRAGRAGRVAAVALILTIVASDQINSSFLKELFGRIRPCHVLDEVRLLVPCGGGKSFPSSHATNNFAAAVVLFSFFRREAFILFLVASLMALSRVYVGVHYPMDILAGAAFGTIVALVVTYIVRFIDNMLFRKSLKKQNYDARKR
ncbi:MAG: phosphatase PAP2 family protein [Desulfobulbaceae bacterium]|nr:phosphatase PAP2 family protein [Desulfobulbaceae bacterium]